MPTYLVRWPGLVAALVTARDEHELQNILDEVENPQGCTWSVYRGPLFLELQLNAQFEIDDADERGDRPLQPDQIRVGDVARLRARELLTAKVPEHSDASDAMVDAIMRKAFPSVHAVLDNEDEDITEAAVRGAVRVELDNLVKATWQHEQTKRRTDQAGKTAAMMFTKPELVERWQKNAAAAAEARARRPSPPTKPKRSPKRPKK
jgi:hypothetical protein